MRQWSKSPRRSSGSMPVASAAGNCSVAVRENWPRVVKDARLHDALRSMYIPPSLLRIGSTIGRGLYNI